MFAVVLAVFLAAGSPHVRSDGSRWSLTWTGAASDTAALREQQRTERLRIQADLERDRAAMANETVRWVVVALVAGAPLTVLALVLWRRAGQASVREQPPAILVWYAGTLPDADVGYEDGAWRVLDHGRAEYLVEEDVRRLLGSP